MAGIKILFVILLLFPVGLLMRQFLLMLSREVPKQALKRSEKSGNRRNKRSEKKAERQRKKNKITERKTGKTVDRDNKPDNSNKQSKDGGYTPRKPEKWERSERVPFGESEGYRVKPSDVARSADKKVTKDEETVAFAETKPEDSARKKKNRSDKQPTKRQLRKNRERARKRDQKKRKSEREKDSR